MIYCPSTLHLSKASILDDISSCRFAGCNHNKWLNLWGAQSRRERTQWDHPSLCSGLIDHAWGWEKMHCHFPQRRDVLMLYWKLWQQAKKAAGVETRTESPLFEPGCAHHSEILFRHTAVFCAVILYQSTGTGLLFLLGISTSAGNLNSTPQLSPTLFAAGLFGPDISRVLRTFSAMLFPAVVPQLPVCLLLDSWDTEQSLLGFLRNDCCFLNNLEQAWRARSSEGQRHSLRKIW